MAASCQVKYQQPEFIDEDDDIADLPSSWREKYRYIHDAPIIVDMMTSNSVGIVGRRKELDIMVRNMTLDLALRHFYKEVKLFYHLCRGGRRESSAGSAGCATWPTRI